MKGTTNLFQYKKLIIVVLLVIAIFSVLFGLCDVISVNALTQIQYEDKIYHIIDDAMDYADNKVLVVLDKNISDINKVHDNKLFGNFDKMQIVELTAREHLNNNLYKGENFRQIFEITLPGHNKENVVAAIDELDNIQGILTAEPDYYFETCAISTPNDTLYDGQWALHGKNGINAPLAWGGNDRFFRYTRRGYRHGHC